MFQILICLVGIQLQIQQFSLFLKYTFFINLRRKTQLRTNIQIHLTVPLTAGKDSKSSCSFYEVTLHKICSIEPWLNQQNTQPFIKRFRNFTKRDGKSVKKTLEQC